MSILNTSALRREYAPACTPKGDLYLDMFRAIDAVLKYHGYRPRAGVTGSFNCRHITGGTGYSLHAFGPGNLFTFWTGVRVTMALAVDINWDKNPYGRQLVTDMPLAMRNDLKAIRTNSGKQLLGLGADYRTNHDAMHIEGVCSKADLMSGVNWSTVVGHAPVKPPANAGRTWETFAGAGTTDAAVYAKGGLDNEVSQVQWLIGHKVTGTYTAADADAIAKLKTLARWVDPDEPKHNRTSGVTPAFHQALEGLHGAKG
jgi:hypothetical protein